MRTTLKVDRSSQKSIGIKSSKSIRSRPGSAVRGQEASLEEEFMLAIQSGNIAPPNLDLIGKALTNQHMNGIAGYLLCQLIRENRISMQNLSHEFHLLLTFKSCYI